MSELNITAIVETFANQITAVVEASVSQRLQAAIAGAFGAPQKRGPGRPPRQAVAGVASVAAQKKQTVAHVKILAAQKKTRTATPKATRARKLQGQYLGALKSLKGADRAKVKAAAKEQGVAEAVKLAEGMKKA